MPYLFLSFIGFAYTDVTNTVRCSPVASSTIQKCVKFGPIVGGAVGGLLIIIIALTLWCLRKKRARRSNLPPSVKRNMATEPSWVVDNESPWHDMDEDWFSNMTQTLGNQGNDGQPIMEPDTPHRPLSIAPQVCLTTIPVHYSTDVLKDDGLAKLVSPSSASRWSEIETGNYIQPQHLAGHPLFVRIQVTSSRLTLSCSYIVFLGSETHTIGMPIYIFPSSGRHDDINTHY
jgi:hypothetical protein